MDGRKLWQYTVARSPIFGKASTTRENENWYTLDGEIGGHIRIEPQSSNIGGNHHLALRTNKSQNFP